MNQGSPRRSGGHQSAGGVACDQLGQIIAPASLDEAVEFGARCGCDFLDGVPVGDEQVKAALLALEAEALAREVPRLVHAGGAATGGLPVRVLAVDDARHLVQADAGFDRDQLGHGQGEPILRQGPGGTLTDPVLVLGTARLADHAVGGATTGGDGGGLGGGFGLDLGDGGGVGRGLVGDGLDRGGELGVSLGAGGELLGVGGSGNSHDGYG